MPAFDLHGRPDPPRAGTEVETLLGFLEFQRATLEWKCSGLDRDQLAATTAASTMTLGGLLNHLAAVEDGWFSVDLHGNDVAAPWDGVDWDSDRDWEWRTALDEEPEVLRGRWRAAVERSRELVGRPDRRVARRSALMAGAAARVCGMASRRRSGLRWAGRG